MRYWNLKRSLLLAFSLAILLIVVLWQTLISTGISYFLTEIVHEQFQARFQFEKVFKEGAFWVVDHPSVITNKELKEGGLQFEGFADRLLIDYHVNLLDREVDILLTVVNPCIEIGKFSEISRLFANQGENTLFFKVNTRVVVQQGELAFHPSSANLTDSIPIYFEMDMPFHSKAQGHLAFGLKMQCRDVNYVEIDAMPGEDGQKKIAINIHHVDCSLFYQLGSRFYPQLDHWNVESGILDGLTIWNISKDGNMMVSGNAELQQLAFQDRQSQFRGEAKAISFQLQDIPYGRSEGQLVFSEEAFISYFKTPELGWKIDHLTGGIFFDSWEQAKIVFKGQCSPSCDLRPELFKQFENDKMTIQTEIKLKPNELVAEGNISVLEKEGKNNRISFGFTLKPPYAHQGGKMEVSNGWFSCQNMALEKFVSPYFFIGSQFHLRGEGDFSGTFTHQDILVKYEAREIHFETPDYTLEVDRISCRGDKEDASSVSSSADYHIDLESGKVCGKIPIFNGTFYEKNSGLLFTAVNTQISLEENHVHIDEVETFCKGIYFAGAIDVDYTNLENGVFSIDINSHTMNAKVSQLQQLFSHFNYAPFFFGWPLEGNVGFRDQGGRLCFSFNPAGCEWQLHTQGALVDGKIFNQESHPFLQDISLNFEYNRSTDFLGFSDIQGTLMVGKSSHIEEYTVIGDHICFENFSKSLGNFDVWIGDKTRDVMRLVGKVVPSISDNGFDYTEFLFDHELTHFGDVHPRTSKLILKNWSQIETFQLQLGIHLDTLLHDVQSFSRTGLFFIPHNLLEELNELKTAEGIFFVDVDYENQNSQLNYRVVGEKIAIANHEFKKFFLEGKKRDKIWMVDQLCLDELSLAADVLREENRWKINFLGVRYGKSLLMGLEGEYIDGDKYIDADVHLLEMDLAHLDEWPQVQYIKEKFPINGNLHAIGDLKIEIGKGTKGWKLEALLKASLRSAQLNGVALQDMDNFSCRIATDQRVALGKLKTGCILKPGQMDLEFDKAEYHVSNRELAVEDLHFNIAAENLGWVVGQLEKCFPDQFFGALNETLLNIKTKGNLQGILNFNMMDPYYSVKLTLADGLYTFEGQDYDLKNFVLEYAPSELKIATECNGQKNHCFVMIRSISPLIDSGEIVISESPFTLNSKDSSDSLFIHWQKHPKHGFVLDRVSGDLFGMNMQMERDLSQPIDSNYHYLQGKVKCDLFQASQFFPEEISKKLTEWQAGDGYVIAGSWKLGKCFSEDRQPELHFEGTIEGADFELYGYRFESLFAKVMFTPSTVRFQDLEIKDRAGIVSVKEIYAEKDSQSKWFVKVPQAELTDYRPSLLHQVGTPLPEMTSTFVVRHLELQDFSGGLNEIESFKGTGKLNFASFPKKNFKNTIFAIPAEIMTRIGLDLAVLNPVTGTIFYEIKDGKIFLDKFKDVYSDGKLSRFYLPKTSYQSYMDFEGNLHVQVRMKQYNLIFKLAELFTVTIQGNLQKPTYTLQKQNRAEDYSSIP